MEKNHEYQQSFHTRDPKSLAWALRLMRGVELRKRRVTGQVIASEALRGMVRPAVLYFVGAASILLL